MPDTPPTKYAFERFPRKAEVPTAQSVADVSEIANAIKRKVDALRPVSTTVPDTVNKILERQNALVGNMNALAGQ